MFFGVGSMLRNSSRISPERVLEEKKCVKNTKKQANSIGEVPRHGMELDFELLKDFGNSRKFSSPSIQVSIPYHPQATNPLRRVEICAPQMKQTKPIEFEIQGSKKIYYGS
ncbi:hypothetical protein L1987_08366 [Smallanthus sonchifolius]|uniref:Uncharacterized protein n=1 Tax=Smallanthus sonchifolius TaxID=185202 RepID=A0ACB9JL04_9ASTR|nr:hypothetical protein L1987_08366 [Smallanthus sonchifolius]